MKKFQVWFALVIFIIISTLTISRYVYIYIHNTIRTYIMTKFIHRSIHICIYDILTLLLGVVCCSKGIDFCPITATLQGGCGPNANFDCFEYWNGKCGASGMASKCKCSPIGSNQHSCTCLVVCDQCHG